MLLRPAGAEAGRHLRAVQPWLSRVTTVEDGRWLSARAAAVAAEAELAARAAAVRVAIPASSRNSSRRRLPAEAAEVTVGAAAVLAAADAAARMLLAKAVGVNTVAAAIMASSKHHKLAVKAAASPRSVMADPSGIAAAPAPTEPDAGAEGDDNEAQTLLPRRADSAAAPGSDDSRPGAGRATGGAGGGSASDSDGDSVFLDSPVAGRRPGSVGAAATNPYWQIDGAMRNPLAGQPPLETPSSRHHQVCKPGNNQNPVAPWCAVRYTVQARQRCVLLHHTPLLSGDTARSCLVQQVQDRPCASC